MKAYKIELLVLPLNDENMRIDEITTILEEHVDPLFSTVIKMDSRDIGEWNDDHPLNSPDTMTAEYERLFNDSKRSN